VFSGASPSLARARALLPTQSVKLSLLGLLGVAALGTSLGCAELLDLDGRAAKPVDPAAPTETACAARSARGVCTEWVPHETPGERWLRETMDESAREEAYRKGEPFLPRARPGDTAEEDVRRMREEHRREEAFRRGEPFFPDHQAGETGEGYLQRMNEERRRQEAYRKGQAFVPGR
jgi:hypothetical protein